jgi:hypothetical protein
MEMIMWLIRRAPLASIAGLAAILAAAAGLSAAPRFDSASVKLDKTRGAETRSLTPANEVAQQLLGKRYVNLDLEVLIDGTDDDAVQTSIEPADRRYPAKCGPGVFGSLIMTSDIEYFFTSRDNTGKQVRVSIYPGARTAFPFNKVTCLPGPRPDTAVFKVQGYYLVDQDDLGTEIELQLRAFAAPAE